jgi:hypothetical protein
VFGSVNVDLIEGWMIFREHHFLAPLLIGPDLKR